MSTSAHHFMLLAERVVKSALSFCLERELISWLKTIDSGHLSIMPVIMDIPRQLTHCSSGRQTLTSCHPFRTVREELLLLLARMTM